ncbi:MAG: hypothetical protein P8Q48_02145 [Paracoccaceae bacterium]|nr:hypothetical protein [Paracoccaceae bacterium]
MRHFHAFAICLIAALPVSAETLRTDDGRVTTVVQLSDDLSAHPGFAAFLRDEALAIREDAALTAEEDDKTGWTVEITDQAGLITPAYASVLRKVTTRKGNFGFQTVEALNWDAEAGDFFRLDRFFADGQMREEALIAIAFRLKVGIAKDIWGRKVPSEWNPMVEQATSPDVAVLSNFTLARGTVPGKAAGLTFHFSPKEIAPQGRAQALTIPLSPFAKWLNDDGRALFGGALTR